MQWLNEGLRYSETRLRRLLSAHRLTLFRTMNSSLYASNSRKFIGANMVCQGVRTTPGPHIMEAQARNVIA